MPLKNVITSFLHKGARDHLFESICTHSITDCVVSDEFQHNNPKHYEAGPGFHMGSIFYA